MPQADSVDKIVGSYFATVTAVPFVYKRKRYEVPELSVSPLLLRGYTCPMNCGGCCPKFSLDYLPGEARPEGAVARTVEFNGRTVELYTDMQSSNSTDRCRHLNRTDGRCGIYLTRPFSCDFELIRMMPTGERGRRMTQQLFSRGWAMKRVDGGKGALCQITPPNQESIDDVVRKLTRLKQWTDHFGLATRVPTILDWISLVRQDLDTVFPLQFPAERSLV